MARYHAKDARIYLSTTGTGTASPLTSFTAWTLDLATDLVEVTSFGDTNKTYVQGLRDVQGTMSGFWDDSETKLFTASTSTDGVKIYLYFSTNATSKYAYGTAWLSVAAEAGVSDAAQVSANFSAKDSWGILL